MITLNLTKKELIDLHKFLSENYENVCARKKIQNAYDNLMKLEEAQKQQHIINPWFANKFK